jgi:putative peptidoglycan lipid II flippase
MTDTVRRILVLAVPVFFGSTVAQINSFVSKMLASGLTEGSISALNYSYFIINLISGLSTTAISTILYPKMAKAYSLSDESRFSELFSTGLTLMILLGMPFTLGSLLYSGDIIQIIYERGAFGGASTALTSFAFFYYSIGIVFLMMQSFIVSAFYSRHDTKTPLLVAALAVAVNITANLLLVGVLAHGGLALGWSLAALCNAVILFGIIQRRGGILAKGFRSKNIKIALASLLAVGAGYLFFLLLGRYFAAQDWVLPRIVLLGVSVLLTAAVYMMLLRILKIKELSLFRQMFRTRSTL